jgi:hypothetical protein
MKRGVFTDGILMFPGDCKSTIPLINNLPVFCNQDTSIESPHKKRIKKMPAGREIVTKFLFAERGRGYCIRIGSDSCILEDGSNCLVAGLSAADQKRYNQQITANSFQQDFILWVIECKNKRIHPENRPFLFLFFRLPF